LDPEQDHTGGEKNHREQMTMKDEGTEQNLTEIEPTGGWQQYRLAVWVLTLYPILILGTGFIAMYGLPHARSMPARTEVVLSMSHEPFHLSLTAPSGQVVGHEPLAYGPAFQQR
jgi:hypothetical protein